MELVKSKKLADGKEYYYFKIEASVIDGTCELAENLEDVFRNDDKIVIESMFHDMMVELVNESDRCESCGYAGILEASNPSERDTVCECSERDWEDYKD